MKIAEVIKQLESFDGNRELVCTAVIQNPGSHECTLHLFELDERVYLTMVTVKEGEEESLI